MLTFLRKFVSRNRINRTLKTELETLRRWSQRAKGKQY
jgi:hypothetical protein